MIVTQKAVNVKLKPVSAEGYEVAVMKVRKLAFY